MVYVFCFLFCVFCCHFEKLTVADGLILIVSLPSRYTCRLLLFFPPKAALKINGVIPHCSSLPFHRLYTLRSLFLPLFSNIHLQSYTEPSISYTCSYSANQQLEIYVPVSQKCHSLHFIVCVHQLFIQYGKKLRNNIVSQSACNF